MAFTNATSILLFTVANESNGTDKNYQQVPCTANMNLKNQALIASFTIIFCLSVIGNSLVIVTIIQQRWMRTVTNLYLLNLAISDLMLCIICMPPSLLGLLLKCFLFGRFICKAVAFLQPVSVTASAYTLAVIALERYYAICRPLHSRHWQTKSHAAKMIAVVWTISVVSNVFNLFNQDLYEIRKHQFNCRIADWLANNVELVLVNQVLITVLLFLLPLCIMVVLYGLVIRSLWLGIQLEMQSSEILNGSSCDELSGDDSAKFVGKGRRALQRIQRSMRVPVKKLQTRSRLQNVSRKKATQGSIENDDAGPSSSSIQKDRNPAQKDNFRLRSTHMEKNLLAKKRVIKMLVAVVVLFFTCWTPLFTLFMTSKIAQLFRYRFTPIWQNLNVAFLTIAYISCCTNPLAYCFFNRKFRQAFLLAFGCSRFITEPLQTQTQAPGTSWVPPRHSPGSSNVRRYKQKPPVVCKMPMVKENHLHVSVDPAGSSRSRVIIVQRNSEAGSDEGSTGQELTSLKPDIAKCRAGAPPKTDCAVIQFQTQESVETEN